MFTFTLRLLEVSVLALVVGAALPPPAQAQNFRRARPVYPPAIRVYPDPRVQQYAANLAVLGRAYSQVPPYALGYNPYFPNGYMGYLSGGGSPYYGFYGNPYYGNSYYWNPYGLYGSPYYSYGFYGNPYYGLYGNPYYGVLDSPYSGLGLLGY